MEESDLIKKLKQLAIKYEQHIDTFDLYFNRLKPDLSGLKTQEELASTSIKGIQFKEGMNNKLKSYSYAVQLELLCDLYLSQPQFMDNLELVNNLKKATRNYISDFESTMNNLFQIVEKIKGAF